MLKFQGAIVRGLFEKYITQIYIFLEVDIPGNRYSVDANRKTDNDFESTCNKSNTALYRGNNLIMLEPETMFISKILPATCSISLPRIVCSRCKYQVHKRAAENQG